MRKLLIVAAMFGMTQRADALNQKVHYQITYDACIAEGGPVGFCEQVGVAAHNVDDYEFFDLSAHSQMEEGQTACDGANAAIWRVYWFGGKIRRAAEMAAVYQTHASISDLAHYVGRALHTVQDNCAHSGMGNPQHAWKSISDFCDGTETSPDVQPEALACGAEETRAVMDAVFAVLEDNGAVKAQLDDVDEAHNHMTDLSDGCHFLGDAGSWDGEDRRWDNTIVRPYMRNELISAISNDDAKHGWVCNSAPDGLLVSYDNDVDVSAGPAGCAIITIACLGKADGEGSGTIGDVPPPPETGGCSAGGAGAAGWLIALAALAPRSRRRRPQMAA